MRAILRTGILVLLLVVSCSPPTTNSTDGTFAYDESALNRALVAASRAQNVTYSQFDAIVLPPGQRSVVGIQNLGKYLFGDEYVDDLTALGGTPSLSANSFTNTWSPQGDLSETVRQVTGLADNLVRAAYKVDASDPNHANQYHVYRYQPWTANLAGLSLNVWFGTGHVFYLNPVLGQVAPGQPYLELFPVTTPTLSNEVDEVRLESTSYYKFRGLSAGEGPSDLGSPISKMETVLGAPTSTVAVASMSDIVWTDRGVLYTYPLGGSTTGAYIHYDLANDVKVRIFLTGTGSDLFIKAMYFVRTP